MTRRRRTATESLLQVALVLEAVLVFFITITVFGLRLVDPAIAFGGGAALVVLLALTAGLVRHPWAVWLGWVLQAVLVATGLLLPILYAVGLGFAGIWTYCFVRGRQLDRAREEFLARHPELADDALTDPPNAPTE
ncbi:uncharacterized protein DUF4233 [Diaminobutyricimonas aerilata]|uniref:Uncharacterized protein DUF4233 n=1 Tax=Diaminobutyricimonas aerilata TaxID=1162967 RepID=A0A2M9CJ83_9MICO|nr:DUF4233 domain-containing protein [Diaminobutyricimonas aerilata]PJJ71963.1 uncharacterized protein DUF4233 [Diaminobutyricimonas aerilata]